MRVGLDMQSTLSRPTGIGRYAQQILALVERELTAVLEEANQ